jgi:hypothetical protein
MHADGDCNTIAGLAALAGMRMQPQTAHSHWLFYFNIYLADCQSMQEVAAACQE